MDRDDAQPRSPDPPRRPPRRGWTTLHWGVLTLAALLPVVVSSVYSHRVASRSVRELVQSTNVSNANIVAELVARDMEHHTVLARAFAALPTVVDAVERHDEQAVRDRLEVAVNSSPRVERAFVTDLDGTQWSDFPNAPEALGRNWSDRDWYQGVTRGYGPYVSAVALRRAEPQYLIVAVAAPIRNRQGGVIGYLVYQCRLDSISEGLSTVRPGRGGSVFVVDHKGTLAVHSWLNLQTRRYEEYGGLAPVQRALRGEPVPAVEYTDPLSNQPVVATFVPIPLTHRIRQFDRTSAKSAEGAESEALQRPGEGRGPGQVQDLGQPQWWVVVAQQPTAEAYAPIDRLATNIGTAGLLLAAVAAALVLVLGRGSERNRRLGVELGERHERLQRLAGELEQAAAAERGARVEAEGAHAQLRRTHDELRRAHDELREAQARMIQAEKLAGLGQLVAGVAHEINNPLAFVANNLVVLDRDVRELCDLIAVFQEGGPVLAEHAPELAARAEDLADRIDLAYTLDNVPDLLARSREGLRRIQQIVKDLRDFARHDAVGELQEGADLNAGVGSTLNIVRGQARKKRVEVEADLSPLPPVTCAPAKINQVLLNLVSNAMDACEEGGKVTVRTRPSADGNGVRIEVSDTGPGIDPAVLPRIFDPFFTTKRQGEGMGLGLSISHGIVADHGGRIDVDTAPGRGTTFTVRLPLQPPPPAPARSGAGNGSGMATPPTAAAPAGANGEP